ncbi:phospholipase A2, membrane associated-like [Geospiza fortis]|uniref:Phospholipase A2, membrane associated-like n=1 Tax=Geospiza fortis TaxID=48883 RepID=A0A6I9HRQ5_GEOFO|nr:phospholipase A2, membrane associated-like [Geospiza fortis]
MRNLLLAVLLACGLLRAGGSVLELERMIRAATGRSAPLSYSWYGTEQSWCQRETCLCDTAVASCFASSLHSYNNSYRFYFKLKCQGSKLQC